MKCVAVCDAVPILYGLKVISKGYLITHLNWNVWIHFLKANPVDYLMSQWKAFKIYSVCNDCCNLSVISSWLVNCTNHMANLLIIIWWEVNQDYTVALPLMKKAHIFKGVIIGLKASTFIYEVFIKHTDICKKKKCTVFAAFAIHINCVILSRWCLQSARCLCKDKPLHKSQLRTAPVLIYF